MHELSEVLRFLLNASKLEALHSSVKLP